MTELGPLPEEWRVVRGFDLFSKSTLQVKDLKNEFRGTILSIPRYAGLIPHTEKFGKRVAGHDLRNYQIVLNGQL
ncbi:hypothetical protein L6232_26030, partial [Shewanella sp. C31]|nr:hypothetical protein [Shewanella electrica]